ncbi:MAG: nitroreductase family protein [Thermodesulfobacteriota bacterium]
MDALTCLMTRRSIRKYAPGDVSEDLLEKLLRAAMSAPSAGNAQPWHFVAIRDRAALDEIDNFHPYAKMVREVPLAVLVCAEPAREKHKGFWVQDCSAATMNLLLAAHALGLGSVWVGIYPEQDRMDGFRRLLGLPGDIVPFALAPVGHPAQKAGEADRFAADRVRVDRW